MSVLGDIEAGVIALVEAVEHNGEPALVTIAGWAAADRRSAVEQARSLAMPAVLVSVGQRERAPSGLGGAADERVTLLISAQSLRSADGARVGDVDSVGAFALADLVTLDLEAAVIASAWRLAMLDQQVVASDERTVVVEQRWAAERLVEASAPTFGGVAIAGDDSIVSEQVGGVASRDASFAFAGIDGTFLHRLGADSRAIVWRGLLRADDHDAMNVLEAGIEALVASSDAAVVGDSFGQMFSDCVVTSFERNGSRRMHASSSRVIQPFEIQFVQLAGQLA